MKWLKILTLGLLCFALQTSSAPAKNVEREQKQFELTDEKSVTVNIDFGAGSLELAAGPGDLVLDADVEYEPRYVEFFADYRKRGGAGMLELSSEMRRSGIDGDITNTWRLGVTDRVPVDLEMDIGAADADLDLSGLKLTDLDLDVGAADARVHWDRPNPISLRRLQIDCGASSLKLSGLGHANLERFDFEGGVGSFDLSFDGDWQQSAEVLLEVGLGSVDIAIPDGVAARIEVDDSFLSSVDIDQRFQEVADDVYESEDYGTADIRLDLSITLGLGSVDIRSVPR